MTMMIFTVQSPSAPRGVPVRRLGRPLAAKVRAPPAAPNSSATAAAVAEAAGEALGTLGTSIARATAPVVLRRSRTAGRAGRPLEPRGSQRESQIERERTSKGPAMACPWRVHWAPLPMGRVCLDVRIDQGSGGEKSEGTPKGAITKTKGAGWLIPFLACCAHLYNKTLMMMNYSSEPPPC